MSSACRSSLARVGYDTATQDTAVCVLDDGGEVLREAVIGLSADGSPGHTTRLLEEIERSVDAAGGWKRIESIAVGLGPGSFTGLRVGIATARALGASLGVPVRGAGTLDAIAAGLRERAGDDGAVCAVIDARRGEVFASLHGPSGRPVWGPWVGSPEGLAEKLAQEPEMALAGGSGAVRFRDELAGRGVAVPDDDDPVHRVAGRHVCALAAAGPGDRPLDPIYLRPPDAERWRERDSADRNK